MRKSLLESSRPIQHAHAEKEGFDLASVTVALGLKPQEDVYVNWDDLKTIDRVRFSDLVGKFDYVWYPGPDDIDIFDDSLSWVLSVDHGGYLRVWEPASDSRSSDDRPDGPRV